MTAGVTTADPKEFAVDCAPLNCGARRSTATERFVG